MYAGKKFGRIECIFERVIGLRMGHALVNEVIQTARLNLRRATEVDLPLYCSRIYGDPAVMRFLPGGRAQSLTDSLPRARGHLIDHWVECGLGTWLVEERDTSRVVGHCGLHTWPGTLDIEVMYALEPSAWGKGYATEGARAAVQYGFERRSLSRIIAAAFVSNEGSIRVMQKLGFTFWKGFEFEDAAAVMYQLASADWAPTSP